MDAGLRLARFVARLPRAADADDVARELLEGPLVPFAGMGSFLALRDRETLAVRGLCGYPVSVLRPDEVLGIDEDLPVCSSVREGIVRFDTMPEALDRFSGLRDLPWTWPDGRSVGAIATMPLRTRGLVIGALSIATEHTMPWSTRDLAYLEGLASAVALWSLRDSSARPDGGEREARLTPRQQQVLRLIRRGMANSAIAASLGVSASTVKAEVGELLRAFDVRSREALSALDAGREGR